MEAIARKDVKSSKKKKILNRITNFCYLQFNLIYLIIQNYHYQLGIKELEQCTKIDYLVGTN